MAGRLAARMSGAMLGGLALIGETGRERAAKMLDRTPGVIAVITPVFASQQHMQRVVHIVVPLRGVIMPEPPGFVAVVF